MGMTIEESMKVLQEVPKVMPITEESINVALDTMHKYQLMQADYENRLKADMVAMLDELDLKLYEQYDDTDLIKVKYVRQTIQQKINALRGE